MMLWPIPLLINTALKGSQSHFTHYVYTLKQELDGTRAYQETDTNEMSVTNAHLNELKFFLCVNEGQDKLLTMYWFP